MLCFEGILDELIYQIEFTVRQALPPDFDWDKIVQNPSTMFSHLISAFMGASISLLSTYIQQRRNPLPIPAAG